MEIEINVMDGNIEKHIQIYLSTQRKLKIIAQTHKTAIG